MHVEVKKKSMSYLNMNEIIPPYTKINKESLMFKAIIISEHSPF